LIDLHCHLLFGLDDGAKTLDDSLEMGRTLVELGFTAVAPSPHNRPEYAPPDLALARLDEVRQAFDDNGVKLELYPNSENFFLDEALLPSLSRRIGSVGAYLLVEAPYTSPLPALTEILFRIKLKGVTPLIAHPERCFEFERKGRAKEAVDAGALLQLDIGAMIGRYGPVAKKVARTLLDEGLYAVGATDLHAPVGALEWVGRSLSELRARAGGDGFEALMRTNPARILRGEALE
jgi:protein-tyrosine phosphatase